jgi:hypothetical protein
VAGAPGTKGREYRLREQQGLSPPATSEYSSSGEGEEEESDGGRLPREVGACAPLTERRGGGRGTGAWGGVTTRPGKYRTIA